MSKGPGLEMEKPLWPSSSCMDEQPASSTTPSNDAGGTPLLLKSISASDIRPGTVTTLPLEKHSDNGQQFSSNVVILGLVCKALGCVKTKMPS